MARTKLFALGILLGLCLLSLPCAFTYYEVTGKVVGLSQCGIGNGERTTIYFEDGESLFIRGSVDVELGSYYIFTVKDIVGRADRVVNIERDK